LIYGLFGLVGDDPCSNRRHIVFLESIASCRAFKLVRIEERKSIMNTRPMATTRGPIDVHVHLSGNGKTGMDCWHRPRWIMRPFLRAGARDIGLECGFDALRFDELYLNKLASMGIGNNA
jgi:hypothetical protein